MMTLSIIDNLYQRISTTIQAIPKEELSDIYAFSLYIYDLNDEPKEPTVTVGYNTYSCLKMENDGDIESNSEPKWNYAFWLQNELNIIGEEENDPIRPLLLEWMKSNDLYYDDEDFYKEGVDEDELYEKGGKITDAFVKTLIVVVQRLHQNGIVKLPVLIHELEYYDQILEQNQEANGALADDFVQYWRDEFASYNQ